MTMASQIAAELAVARPSRPARAGWLAFARGRLRGRPDSEHEIFINRLALSCVIGAYLVVASRMGSAEARHVLGISTWMFWLYNFMGGALFLHLLAWPGVSAFRRCAGICIDFWIIAAFDHVGDSASSFIYPLYLWTIFGNGFRFGIPYLAIATAAGLVAFGSVVLRSPYWQANPTVAAGLVGGLVILPAYVGVLIRKLSIAKRQAEEANKAKSMFLASVSHELRTPLTAIIGLTDLLQDTKLSRDQADMTQTVGAAGRGLLQLINSILDVSRTQMGKVPVALKRFDLHLLLAQTHAMLAVQAAAKGIRLSLHTGARTPRFIVSSERHLQEVLVNLAGNAIKFTDRGHVLISVELAGARDGALRLRFEVEDSGIGIAHDAQTRIFETFTQADETIIDRFGGTGLGLSISRQLVEALDGRMGVASAKDEGSTFWFEIEARVAGEDGTGTAGAGIAVGRPVLVFSGDPRLQAAVERLGADARMVSSHAEVKAGIDRVLAQGRHRPVVLMDQRALGEGLEAEAARLASGNKRDSPILVAVAAGASCGILSRQGRQLFSSCLPRPLAAGPLVNILQVADGSAGEQARRQRLEGTQANRKVHILLAEDNRTNQKVIARILEKAGHTVEIACDGEAALEALQERAFQIVLMDINMPVLNGIEAAKLYRFGQMNGPRVPIVALTADATHDSRARCLEAGMEACLTKPIDAAELMATIDALAGEAEAEQDVFRTGSEPVAEAAGPHSGDPILDMRALDDLEKLGGAAFIDEIVSQFTADAASVLKELADAVRACDVETFKDQAHALRSCAANVGAHRVYATCLAWRAIEASDLARNGEAYFAALAGELADAQTSLAGHLARMGIENAPAATAKPHLRLVS